MTTLRERRIGSLFTVWTSVVVLAAAIYWLQAVMPAFVEILRPLYALLGVILLVATWKWLRRRSRNNERRHDDRRHPDQSDLDRRHNSSDGSGR